MATTAQRTFKGSMYIERTLHENYIANIRKLSKDKIQVSCVSSPLAFTTFEGNVNSVNNNITMYSNPTLTVAYWKQRTITSKCGLYLFFLEIKNNLRR